MTLSAPCEKSKSLGSGWSMVARLKLKGFDGGHLILNFNFQSSNLKFFKFQISNIKFEI